MPTVTWADVPKPFRVLGRWVTIAQAAGFGVGLAFARQNMERFNSSPDTVSSVNQLLLSAHSHLLGMTALFALSGICFALCSKPEGALKARLISLPFLAIVLAFTAIWLMKYWYAFVWLLLAAMLTMSVCFYWQIIVTLRELRSLAKQP